MESADANPIPADGYAPDPRPVDGDDLRWAATGEVYLKELWGELGLALKMAQDGDGSLIRELVDLDYERNDDGTYGNGYDLYFTIGASEQRYPRDVGFYLDLGDDCLGPVRRRVLQQRLRRAQLRPLAGARQGRLRRAVQGGRTRSRPRW